MTSGLSTGVTTYCAPALTAASAVFSSSTLPTPTSALLPNSRVTSAMTCSAFGVVMVTSMPETPPAMSARLASMSCSELSARMIATTPGVSRPSMICSLVMGLALDATGTVAGQQRLDFREAHEVEVAADGVLQAARGHGELDRVLRR